MFVALLAAIGAAITLLFSLAIYLKGGQVDGGSVGIALIICVIFGGFFFSKHHSSE